MDRPIGVSWSGVSRVGVVAFAAALVATILPMLASDARAAVQPWIGLSGNKRNVG